MFMLMEVHCEIETENHFLLESFAACPDYYSKLTMHLIVNLVFVNYFHYWTNSSVTYEKISLIT